MPTERNVYAKLNVREQSNARQSPVYTADSREGVLRCGSGVRTAAIAPRSTTSSPKVPRHATSIEFVYQVFAFLPAIGLLTVFLPNIEGQRKKPA